MGFILIDFIVDIASLGVHLTKNLRVEFFRGHLGHFGGR